ncbi:TerD family protein [Paraburkholderia sp. EG287A]|uniref:TerD family protein n=1 Tax=Paraburkholderia sp. EG287A TaxID=3237012 RepID=UPI0034D227C5
MLTLGDTHFAVHSREFNILAALLRNGKLVLPNNLFAGLSMGPQLGDVLHSQLSLESLGYVYSKNVIYTMSWLTKAQIAHVHANLNSMLTRALGAHQVFAPMYPNFPVQVLDASDLELLLNAYMHYAGDWLGIRILPKYTEARRPPLNLLEKSKPAVLEVCAQTECFVNFLRLLNGNASLSVANKALVLDMLAYYLDKQPAELVRALEWDVTIPQKETRALVGGWLLQNALHTFRGSRFGRLFQTPTDVLRLATAVSATDLANADLSLSRPQRFGKVSRELRRTLLAMVSGLEESARGEMFQRREQWVRLGEVLHPGEYQKQSPRAYDHFTALRNNNAPVSWTGTVEKSLASRNSLAAMLLLAQRPGVFARKLHEVLRKTPGSYKEAVLGAFDNVADKVSTPVLVQLRQRMLVEVDGVDVQAFSPKAGAGRMWVPQGAAPRLPDGMAESVVARVTNVLAARFAKLPAMGKVYIDPALAGYSVPFGQRTAQKSLLTVGRGTRIDLGDEKIMRAFLWWNEQGVDKDGNRYKIDRTDLDLSCAVLDESFNYIDNCSFTNLRTEGLTHSGDITSAPNGACEFIDIDFENLAPNAAYIALLAYSYTQQNFADMPEAYLGWMARADGQSGAVYDARTVRQKVDLTTSGQRVLVGYVDVARRQFVWADLVLPARCSGFNAVQTSTDMASMLARGIVNPIRPTLGVLLADHAMARGELVGNPADADVVFTSKLPGTVAPTKYGQKVVTAYDAEVLIADYLA